MKIRKVFQFSDLQGFEMDKHLKLITGAGGEGEMYKHINVQVKGIQSFVLPSKDFSCKT